MNWFIFTINFRMIFRIFAYFFCLFSAANTGIDFDSLILLGIVCIFFSGITVCTRFFLSHFRRKSPVFYFLTMCGLPIAFTVLLTMLTLDTPAYSASLSAFSISIASLVYLPAEISYFRKRSHLFDATSAKKTKTTKCSPAPKSSLSEPSISKASLPTHPEVSPTDDTSTRSVEKKEAGSHLRLSRKVKILLFVLFYGAALFIQFMAFTPYTETQTTMSSKNIPHTRVIDSGYTSFYEANDWSTIDAVGISSHTQINTPLFAFQLILTTAIFVFIFFFLYRKHFFTPDNRVKKKRKHTLHYNIKDRLTDILGAGGSIVFFVISYIFLVMPLLVLHLHFLIDILLIFLIATIPLLGFFIELILWICSLVSIVHNPFDSTILNIIYFLALAIYIWGKGIPGLISVFLGFFSRKKNQ